MNMITDRIDKTIHTIWVGPNNLKSCHRRWMKTWKKVNPDFNFIIWTDNPNLVVPEWMEVKCIPCYIFISEWYRDSIKAKKYAYAADIVRSFVIYAYGGIYLDTDVRCIKPFDEVLLNNRYMFGYEGTTHIQGGIFGASAYNDYVKRMLDYYLYNKFDIHQLKTIPILMTEIYKKYNYDFTIYPHDYFICMNQYTRKITLTDNSYTVHMYDFSWGSTRDKIIVFIRMILNRLFGYNKYVKSVLISIDKFLRLFMK